MDIGVYFQVITAVGVIAALINYVITSRRAEKNDRLILETRQAQLYMQIYNRWNSNEMVHAYGQVRYAYQWSDLNDWKSKYSPDVDPESYAHYAILITFFEGLGVLVKKRLIDISLVEDLLSQRVVWCWEHIRSIAFDARKQLNDPTQYDHFEFLYHEMKHRQRMTSRPQVS